MKQAITYNENTGVMGGARPTDLSKEDVLAIALLDYRKNLPLPDNDAPKTNWAELSKNIFNQGFPDQSNVTSTPVVCKDGTTKNQLSSETGKYADACRDNGGRAEIKTVVNETVKYAVIKQDAEDKFYEKLGIQTQSGGFMSGRIDSKLKGRALVLVVLVAGYFAYKKFKK